MGVAQVAKRLTAIFFMACAVTAAADAQASIPPADQPPAPANWGGNYQPCENKDLIRDAKHMDLGVRIATSNPVIARQFRKAMDFWAGVLDMSWHEDNSNSCALAVIDGAPDLFTSGMAARGQFTDRANYQGWIAFNPKDDETEDEIFTTAVHEIGHNLGLHHNASAYSVMYFLSLDGKLLLLSDDLAALRARHTLRGDRDDPITVTPPVKVAALQPSVK